jgi:hypothetical protein
MLNKKYAKTNLLTIKNILDSHKIKFRIGYGTLLGCVREKSFIKNDKDIDLVLEKKYYKQIEKILPDFTSMGFVTTIKKQNYLTLKRKGVSTDFYFFSKRNLADKLLNRVSCGYGLWCIYLKDIYFDEWACHQFLGKQFWGLSVNWLDYAYGEWSIPKNERGTRSRTFTSK